MSKATQENDVIAKILAKLEALQLGSGSPSDLDRKRVIPTDQALKLMCSSPANWRRMRRLNIAPAPVKIGLRKQGYRVGDLLDFIAARSLKTPVAEAA
jgi:hypothetical protein